MNAGIVFDCVISSFLACNKEGRQAGGEEGAMWHGGERFKDGVNI